MSRVTNDAEPAHTQHIDVLFADVPEPAEREGLPPGFRMRADAHYVEVLDSPAGPSLRSLDVSAIETTTPLSGAPPDSLVESVRVHGVLQPLLVQQQGRGGRYRLISGHQRLAAARSAGLGQVPCLLHVVSDAKAAELANAAGIGSLRATPPSAAVKRTRNAGVPAANSCAGALDTTLRSMASAAALMSTPSPVARDAAAQLVAVESQRALRLLTMLRVLGGELPVRRAPVPVVELLHAVRDALEREYRACGLDRSVRVSADRDLVALGSDELLRAATSGIVAALSAAAAPSEPRRFEISGTGDAASVVLDVREQGFSIPPRWAECAFDEAWPVAEGGTALVLLQAAREIAAAHAGSLVVEADGDTTVVRLTLRR